MVAMLQEAIAAIPHPLCIYDANDRVLACSDKYRRIHGPAFVGMGQDLAGHDLRFEQILRATYAEKVPADQVETRVQAELRRHRRNGGYSKDIHSEGRWYRRTKTVGPNGVVVGLSVSIDELIKKSEALEEVRSQLEHQAYHDPLTVLSQADRRIFGTGPDRTAQEAIDEMRPYIAAHLVEGGKLAQITRHMLGIFTGRPGARKWRRILSEGATKPGAGVALVAEALSSVPEHIQAD